MTYFRFHLVFNLPILVAVFLLAGLTGSLFPSMGFILLVLVPVMVFTTPWDNYAAKCGIWGFSSGQYSRKVGFLPIEEYLFFVIQSLQAMGLCLLLFQVLSFPTLTELAWDLRKERLISAGIFFLIWVGVGLWISPGMRHFAGGKWHYTWHLGYWFLPLIAIQWWIAPDVLWPRWPVLVAVTALLGTYLSWADWMAIERKIWFFDHRQTTGINLGTKMPWEEAAFFYLTSLLVAQSFIMILPEALRQ